MRPKSPIRSRRAPFGCREKRFTVTGIYPQLFSRTPGLLTAPKQVVKKEIPQIIKPKSKLEEILGHVEILGQTNLAGKIKETQEKKTKRKIKGLDWKIALETEISSRIPPVLYLETWEKNKLKDERMGPSKYFITETKKPYRISGLMESKEPRFYSPLQNKNPGPGTYIRDRKKKHRCPVVHPFSTFPRKSLLLKGDYLAPNVYFQKMLSDIDKYLNKKVGFRGPYDLFSGDRSSLVRTGWMPETEVFNTKSPPYIPPPKKISGGDFSSSSRNTRPSGRLVCETNMHSWNDVIPNPGPSDYYPTFKRPHFNVKQLPFNKGTRRFEAIYTRRFFNDTGVCGPGRYEIPSNFCALKNSPSHRHSATVKKSLSY